MWAYEGHLPSSVPFASGRSSIPTGLLFVLSFTASSFGTSSAAFLAASSAFFLAFSAAFPSAFFAEKNLANFGILGFLAFDGSCSVGLLSTRTSTGVSTGIFAAPFDSAASQAEANGKIE